MARLPARREIINKIRCCCTAALLGMWVVWVDRWVGSSLHSVAAWAGPDTTQSMSKNRNVGGVRIYVYGSRWLGRGRTTINSTALIGTSVDRWVD